MGYKATDAQIVERLRLIEKYGSATKAAAAIGIASSTMRSTKEEARARGLTANTLVNDDGAALRSRIKELEAQIASLHREEETAESLRQKIYNLPRYTGSPPEWTEKPRPAGLPGVPMTIWSDWHYGEVVNPDEVGGVNEFNLDVADRRIDRLVNRTIDLCMHHMVNPDYPGIVVVLGGDMISGDIHMELSDTNEAYVQQCLLRLQKRLIGALSALLKTFGQVFVVCVVGNHGRNTMKPRAKGRVFESYEWNLYNQLEMYFSARGDTNIQFLIPNETDAFIKVLGHRFLITHGDTLGVKGGDGIIGALGPIARGTFKVGRSEAQIGRDFDTIVMGHYHIYIPRGEAVPAIVNGTLKGYDEYARLMLRVPYSRPSQALWFVHALGITAQWQVFLDSKRKSGESLPWVQWFDRRKQ